MILRPLAVLIALSAPLHAQELATYWANSGSLPPEYAWDVTVTIQADGQLVLKHCKGYETEGPACKTRKAKVAPAQLDAIRTAAAEADLLATPARQTEDIPVGGGSSGGSVTINGEKRDLPAWPIEADAERVGNVLSFIYAAIPARLATKFIEGN